jgi:uroporphyrinogen-III synthase
LADLQGRVVAFLEARRATELTDLIDRHGGVPLAAPCLREVHAPDSPELQDSVRRVCQSQPHVVVFLTGVGTTTVFEAARCAGLDADLRSVLQAAIVVVRGPKPAAVLRKLGVRIDVLAPSPHTTVQVLSALEHIDLDGQPVAVQLYGEPNPELTQSLRVRGAEVLELAPYAWERPIDPAPVVRLLDALDADQVDALLITSQAQVDNLFDIAADRGRAVRLEHVAIGVQGPVAEAALHKRGYPATFRPEHGHMGALVLETAKYFGGHPEEERRRIPHPFPNAGSFASSG